MSDNTVKLQTSDEVFEVELDVACRSRVLRDIIKCTGTGHPVPLHIISGQILRKVIDYCRYHVAFDKVIAHSLNSVLPLGGRLDRPGGLQPLRFIYGLAEQMDRWDQGFVPVDKNTLFDVILAADYLDIEDLVHLTCLNVEDHIRMFFDRKKNLPPSG